MAPARPLSDDEVRQRRLAAQALDRRGSHSVAGLVRHLGGVQSQVLSAASLALGARSAALKAEAVDAARLEERSLVLCWAMRGTLHLVGAEDHGWIVPLTVEPGLANAHRRLKQEGVPAGQPERAVRLIEGMLERDGPLTRGEIADRLRPAGIPTAGQAIAHLLWLAAAGGTICHGPEKGGKQCFVLVRDWLGEQTKLTRNAALAELAKRHLAAHAPAGPADFAAWSGLRLADARSAWAAIRDQLAEVATEQGPLWTLRIPGQPAERALVRLLPAFDEYLLGWKDRRLIAPPEHWAEVNRGGGWVHPVLLFDGRIVATWRMVRKPESLAVEVAPFASLTAELRHGAEAEAEHLGAFLGAAATLTNRPGSGR